MRRSLPLLISVIGAVAGWFCGGESLPEDQASQAARRSASGAIAMAAPAVNVARMSAAEFKARLDAVLASPARDSAELQLLMTRWVATDLQGAKTWMRSVGERDSLWLFSSAQPLHHFFKAWAAIDPAAAMDEALILTDVKGGAAKRAVVAGMVRADVATISAVLQKLPPGDASMGSGCGVEDLVRQLAARDPAAAQTLALQLKGGLGTEAVIATAEVWARTDPQAALAWVRQHGEAATRNLASHAILTEWARRDPVAVGPLLVQKTPGSPDRFCGEAAAEAVARLSAASPADAAAFAAKFIPPEHLKSSLGNFYWRLLADDGGAPQSAATLCQVVGLLTPEALKDAKFFTSGWSLYDVLKPAWDRVLAEPDSPARTFLLGQMGQKLADQQTGAFLSELMKLPDNASRQQLLEDSLSGRTGFLSVGPDDWRAGINSLSAVVESLPESVRSLGALKLAWATAAVDPQESAAVIEKYPSVADNENFVLNLGIQFMGHTDPETAQAWAASLPNEKARASAYEGIATGWYLQDSLAASRWVDSLPPGSSRDAAAKSLATQTLDDDPEAAFTWAASVHDEAVQTETTTRVIRNWVRYDWRAAEAALEQSSLSAAQRAALQEIISQRP